MKQARNKSVFEDIAEVTGLVQGSDDAHVVIESMMAIVEGHVIEFLKENVKKGKVKLVGLISIGETETKFAEMTVDFIPHGRDPQNSEERETAYSLTYPTQVSSGCTQTFQVSDVKKVLDRWAQPHKVPWNTMQGIEERLAKWIAGPLWDKIGTQFEDDASQTIGSNVEFSELVDKGNDSWGWELPSDVEDEPNDYKTTITPGISVEEAKAFGETVVFTGTAYEWFDVELAGRPAKPWRRRASQRVASRYLLKQDSSRLKQRVQG